MKRGLLFALALMLCFNVVGQQSITLRSVDKAECVSSDFQLLRASFSFSNIEAENVETERGQFSWLSMPNTVIGGNEGDPQIPVVNQLIAVPFGATPSIRVTSYSSTDYRLEDFGIQTLVPRQPSLRKDQRPEDVPFVMNEAAYQTRGFRSEPLAVVTVVGTMRGVQLGKMTIEPVSYDPVNNTLRVFNDIEVEVGFDGADAAATEKMLVDTYSPYFDVVYAQMFNGRSLRDAYSEHPDLYTTPVKMLVITTSTYANSTAFQNWVTWKKQKGIYVDVYTTAQTGTTSANIKSFIQTQYNQNHPTFLVIVGDTGDVTYSLSSNTTDKVTDLYYSSPDGDIFPDIFMSRMPVSSTTELANLLNKIMMYEQYAMPDPSYLSKVLLIAGSDGTWNPRVGQPTINYAADNYFNTAHGFTSVYKYLDSYSGCYNNMNTGIGFANYTAHGGQTGWSGPSFSVSDANNLTNNNKYFWAMGNCCLAADWGYSGTCLAEALLRSANKGAFGYIGSCPETYWWEDYYFGVGATSVYNTTPTMSQTQTGTYDAMFMDDMYNTLNSVPFLGNVAVTYAHANSYTGSVSDTYYWEAYHCLGDGSVMPYHVNPSANNVSHASAFGMGLTTFTVNALPGSYVSITKDNEILGVAQVGSTGIVDVPVTPVNTAGDVMIVVTRQQRQPYIQTIPAVALDGPFIGVDSYTPNTALIGQNTDLSITFKNLGNAATTGTTTVTLTSSDSNVSIIENTKTFGALAANATTTVNGFRFCLNEGATLGTNVTLHYSAVNGSDTWEGNIAITPNQIFTVTVVSNNADYGTVSGGGQFNYDEFCTVTATPAEGFMFTSWTNNNTVVSTDAEYTFNVTNNMDLVANFAEGVMIGSGTNTSDYLPSYNYYKYALSEQIYTSAELGGAGLITSIAFYNGGATKTRNYDFYMKATTKNTFSGNTDWIAVTAAEKVFSGSVTMTANEWTTITFNTPFVYDGTSNVVLVADDNTGSYTSSPHMSCRVFDANNQVVYVYSDGSNYNPASPSSYNGTLMTQKNQIIITKEAISTEPVNITVSVSPAQAGTVSGGGEYLFGETCMVSVTPNEGYTFMGWNENGTVVSNDLSYSFIALNDRNLVATFIQAIEIGEATTINNYLPSYNYYNYSLTQQIYTAAEIGTAGTINSIAFFNEGSEKTRTYDIYLKHTTKSSFSSKTDWITVAAADKVFSGNVTLTVGDWTFIIFSTPFEYDGSSNLVVVVDDNSGVYTSQPHMACSAFNTSSSQAIYVYSDDTNYNPLVPPTASSSYNNILTLKSHILLGIETGNPIIEQTIQLGADWNWWSPNVDITLGELKEALGNHGMRIAAQDGKFATYNANSGTWTGNLQSIELGKMYKIRTNEACTITFSSEVVDPALYPITLSSGNNWIGFISTQSMSLNEAFSGFTPTDRDVIKSANGKATYYQGYGWQGSLNTLEPGKGYIYKSNATGTRTFTYPSAK